eukprot:CAMPEP_0203940676 /NCGR_PEP_ID=MMETSP0359-20131031/77206_1 /ASSEMBLY_ACC=CAM_ASM_000338 /TAXON_ID=268821 /ORGANISM="Scrippsiella Hangoei, Strain SHTV-5" /LENGTH=35 /DNA_ID= /DNA_START= /DNA_END= /DNA_ORIENTATION=
MAAVLGAAQHLVVAAEEANLAAAASPSEDVRAKTA